MKQPLDNAATAEVQKSMAWLRNKSGMKIKTGVLHGKRVEYFKGTWRTSCTYNTAARESADQQ